MTVYNKVRKLENARIKINDAIEDIREALKGTRKERSAEVYILGNLNNWANGNHTLDDTIPKLIDFVQEGE